MANLGEVVSGIFSSANTVSNVVNDYTTNQARISTNNKEIQLQYDINKKMRDIQRSSNFENWQQDMTGFFEEIKNGMSNENSPYYCKNNLQAQMFSEILDKNQLGISEKVNQMVFAAETEKDILDTENSMAMIAELYSGQECVDKQNAAWKTLYDGGKITRTQLEAQYQKNYLTQYGNMRTQAAESLKEDALKQNMSAEKFWETIKSQMPELKLRDAEGMEIYTDMSNNDEKLKKECMSIYNAYQQDIWQQTENKFANIWDNIQDQTSVQGRNRLKREARLMLDSYKNTGYMSSDQKIKWTNWLKLEEDLDNARSSGSGSGGSSKVTETFENYLKARSGEALEMLLKDKSLSPNDVATATSRAALQEWMTVPYKENVDKDYDERIKTYDDLYEHRASVPTILDAMLPEIKKKFPEAASYLEDNMKKLIADTQKDPKAYGEEAVSELASWITDWMFSAKGDYTDKDFIRDFNQHKNDCYISKIKYFELNKHGNLQDTYNANKASDIASAAKLAGERDFVHTDRFGREKWVEGKKEALEAKGGIVNVLQNAVVGTLGIPESEYNKIGFYYQPDESGHDMSSKPIITYGDKAYEVIANEDGKGFTVKDVNTGEVMEGKTGGKLKKVMRANQKQEAKEEVKQSSRELAQLKKDRENAVKKAIRESVTTPKAMKAAGGIDEDHWENYKDEESRIGDLRIAARKMDNDANKLSAEKFKEKYGISLEDWTADKVESRRWELILKS